MRHFFENRHCLVPYAAVDCITSDKRVVHLKSGKEISLNESDRIRFSDEYQAYLKATTPVVQS